MSSGWPVRYPGICKVYYLGSRTFTSYQDVVEESLVWGADQMYVERAQAMSMLPPSFDIHAV